MAVMLRRLFATALVLTAVLYLLLGPSPAVAPTELERRVERLSMLQHRQYEAGARWVALNERDSGAVPAARTAKPGKPAIRLRGFGAGAGAPIADQMVNDLWTRLGPADSNVRVTVVIYDAEAYRREHLWTYAGASIVVENGGATCAALLPGELQKDGSIMVGKEWARQVLAPCLLLAGFGPPGPGVERWLVKTRYVVAGSTAWLNHGKSFVDGDGVLPWMAVYGFGYGGWNWAPGLLSNSLLRDIARMLSPHYELGADGLRCIQGDFAACRRNVLDTTTISQGTRGLPADLTYSRSLLDRPAYWSLATPRPPGESWLSDLIRDQGRQKFTRFWKSSAPVEQAFQDAFGEGLGAWTSRWSVRQWENSWFEKYSHSPTTLGATLEPSWLPLVLGWAGVALMLTMLVARRRQVT